MIENSLITLEQLVSKFEENDLDLDQVPKYLVDKYGYACLANALMFKEPKIPEYHLEVAEYIKNHEFSTLDSLISYIKNLQTDIDKLFGIFAYASLNIEYNVELSNSDENRSTTLEEVFITKKAICQGYAIFYEGMTKRVGIDLNRIIINEYPNLSKGRSFDPLHKPKEIKPNHASMYVKIDGVPFISEPTWASGHLTKNQEFERSFRPYLFLIPLYKSLCDHFPCDEAQDLLDFKFSFSDFFQCIKIDPFGRYLKTESNPFVNITCESGYIQQIYSCIGPIDDIGFEMSIMKNNCFKQISVEGITSYEIIETKLPRHPDRCRFKTHLLFPEIGLYKVDMYIDTKPTLTYYVHNKKKSTGSIPVKYNPYHDIKYIPIIPKDLLTIAENGAMIRFAVAKKRSNLIWKIIKLDNEKSFDENGEKIDSNYGKCIKLEIPFDNERYEVQLGFSFPSNGRYCILIFFENQSKKDSYIEYTRYFFDIIDIEPGKEYQSNPVYYMFKGRKFAPIRIFDNDDNEVIVKPNKSVYFVKEREQSIQFKTPSIKDELYFEFRKDGKTIVWPKVCANDGEFRQINFTIPDSYGEYHLKGWVNDSCCIDLLYIYNNNELKDPSDEEEKILNELRSKITHEEYKKDNKKNEEEEKIKKENESRINEENQNINDENDTKESKENEITKDEETIKLNYENENKLNSSKENEQLKIETINEPNTVEYSENDKLYDEKVISEERREINTSLGDDISNSEKEIKSEINIETKINTESENENENQIKPESYKEIKVYNENEKIKIEKENEKLKKENDLLKRAIEKLLKDNKKLKIENEELKKENIKIKKENDDLSKDKSKNNNKDTSHLIDNKNQLNNQKTYDSEVSENVIAKNTAQKPSNNKTSDDKKTTHSENLKQESSNSVVSNQKIKNENHQKLQTKYNNKNTQNKTKTQKTSPTDKKKTQLNVTNKPTAVETKASNKNSNSNDHNKNPKKPLLTNNKILSNNAKISQQNDNKFKKDIDKPNSMNNIVKSDENKATTKSIVSSPTKNSNDVKPPKSSNKNNISKDTKINISNKTKPRLSVNAKATSSNKGKNKKENQSDNSIMTPPKDEAKVLNNNNNNNNDNPTNPDNINTSININKNPTNNSKEPKLNEMKIKSENSKNQSPNSIKISISSKKNTIDKSNKVNTNISQTNNSKISPSNKNTNKSIEIKPMINTAEKLSNKQEVNHSKNIKLNTENNTKTKTTTVKPTENIHNKTKLNLIINPNPKIEINKTQNLVNDAKKEKESKPQMKNKNAQVTSKSKLAAQSIRSTLTDKPKPKITNKKAKKNNE